MSCLAYSWSYFGGIPVIWLFSSFSKWPIVTALVILFENILIIQTYFKINGSLGFYLLNGIISNSQLCFILSVGWEGKGKALADFSLPLPGYQISNS